MAQVQAIIPSTVPYQDVNVATDDARRECDWNTRLSDFIVEYAKGAAVIADQSTPPSGGRTLSMVVSNLHAIAGSGFAGPQWAVVHGELREGDQVVGSFTFRRTSRGKWTTCSTLTSIAEELGEDIGGWLRHPSMEASHGD